MSEITVPMKLASRIGQTNLANALLGQQLTAKARVSEALLGQQLTAKARVSEALLGQQLTAKARVSEMFAGQQLMAMAVLSEEFAKRLTVALAGGLAKAVTPSLAMMSASLLELSRSSLAPSFAALVREMPEVSGLLDELMRDASASLDVASAPHAVQPIGLGAYQIEVIVFLMIFIWMLSVQWDQIFGAGTGLADRAIAFGEVVGVAGLPKVTVMAVRRFIEFLRG
ncbi:hypothetical protein [Kribbella sp. VKM Ac-2566]|uniref:hypothetical protein n=1 Tax=Kribbella sp. VKM Ac-2566 TaxID=2512218 RepID=UPI00106410A4|nr:hypothetical protein [Kribbella sp. VKM Ac-2566]TDX03096.1 hypothetical protein EV647_1325 [Kribbella sp. VKM Ac-2566]